MVFFLPSFSTMISDGHLERKSSKTYLWILPLLFSISKNDNPIFSTPPPPLFPCVLYPLPFIIHYPIHQQIFLALLAKCIWSPSLSPRPRLSPGLAMSEWLPTCSLCVCLVASPPSLFSIKHSRFTPSDGVPSQRKLYFPYRSLRNLYTCSPTEFPCTNPT